jgi:hypothetical protein
LISGILAAEQPAGGPIFIRAFRDIVDEASQDAQSTNIEESRLPQVHALNSIKEIFTTSKLSAASEAYIGEGLGLAARTINSSMYVFLAPPTFLADSGQLAHSKLRIDALQSLD